jgi:hypothetical protein
LKDDVLPSSDHLALHCQPSAFLERDASGTPTGVNADAFRVDEDGISTTWVEYEPGDFNACFAKTCALLAAVRTVRKSHRVGVMNIGKIEDLGRAAGKVIQAIHDPDDAPPANPAHALVVGVHPENVELLHALTLLVELHEFRN